MEPMDSTQFLFSCLISLRLASFSFLIGMCQGDNRHVASKDGAQSSETVEGAKLYNHGLYIA